VFLLQFHDQMVLNNSISLIILVCIDKALIPDDLSKKRGFILVEPVL